MDCPCTNEPQRFDHYEVVRAIGTDPTDGRFATITLQRCRHCARHWLNYLLEYEHLTGSGRYFMGEITEAAAALLRPEDAVPYLESLDAYLYGGSYFDGRTGRSTTKRLALS